MRTIIIFPLVFVLILSVFAHHVLAEEEQCRVSESGEKICEATESGGSGCVDQHENCNFWAEHGECDANSNYLKRNCALAWSVWRWRRRQFQQRCRGQHTASTPSAAGTNVGGSGANNGTG